MKTLYTSLLVLFAFSSLSSVAQEESQDEMPQHQEQQPQAEVRAQPYRIKTIFNNSGPRASGGYVALTNKFTSINGDYANICELYGGWYIGHRFLIGIEMASTTNYIPVPIEHSVNPALPMGYEYAQAGLMTEYIVASDRAIHLGFQLFAGGGFTMQYEKPNIDDDDYWDRIEDYDHDENVFAVAEPGVKVEVNIFRWLRFTPGISYRLVYGNNARGLTNASLQNTSVNMTLKIGKF
jgi:hypothetical protein